MKRLRKVKPHGAGHPILPGHHRRTWAPAPLHIIWAVQLAALLLAGCGAPPAQEKQTEYAVLKVERQDVACLDKYPSTIRGCQDVEIYPQVSGRIMQICVKEGEHVRRGQRLFVIDQVPYRAALQHALANESAAKAPVATARLNYEGKRELHDQQVTSLFELKKAENAMLSAQAALEQAQAQVEEARNNLSYTTLTSPCDGVTGTLPYRMGALLHSSVSMPLTTISDNREMWVYFSIPESLMIAWCRKHGSADAVVKALPEACLYLNDGTEYQHTGRVESISGVLDGQTGSISLKAVFPNPEGLLHSGGAGNVALKSGKSGVIAIPQSATYEPQDKVFVYKLLHGKAVATRVEVKAVSEQRIYIVEKGLEPGDIIIAEGVSMLKDGMPVKTTTK